MKKYEKKLLLVGKRNLSFWWFFERCEMVLGVVD